MRKIFWLIIIVAIGAGLYATRPQAAPVEPVPEIVAETPNKEPKPVAAPNSAAIVFTPAAVKQGEPVLISIQNLPATATVKSVAYNGKNLGVFGASALLGIDLRAASGSFPVTVALSNGEKLMRNLTVGKREVVQAPLGIPETLGGNTPQAEQELVNTLAQEGAIINAIPTSPAKLWSGGFRYPIDGPITVTDAYGYSRLTGASTIAHKGTDFRAATGTPVYAMNSGKVAYVGFLRNYGNVIAIDHGLGLLTIYMHLNDVVAKLGESVRKGELIAHSGNTGYVLGPHLHLTIRINQISIDPIKFLALMGEK